MYEKVVPASLGCGSPTFIAAVNFKEYVTKVFQPAEFSSPKGIPKRFPMDGF